MKINKLSSLNFSRYSNDNNHKKTSEKLWESFKKSKNTNEKRRLLNQLNALEACDEDDDEKYSSKNEKLIKDFNKKRKNESIASKVARGEYITEKERIYLEAHDPGLLEKSRYMNYERKNLEQKIRNAKTKEEAKSIINNAGGFGACLGDDRLSKVANKSVDKARENTAGDVKKIEEENKKRRKKRRHIDSRV